jgi:SPX domain protein involved in polyphosphate accumulation
LRVRYDRISFQEHNSDGFCRITLDQNLHFELLGNDACYAMDVVVMEVKLSGAKPVWLPELFDRIDAKRVKRFSKFANAVEYLSSIPKAAQFLTGGFSE